jgi:DNA-binding beta-propeller fold protein YncE
VAVWGLAGVVPLDLTTGTLETAIHAQADVIAITPDGSTAYALFGANVVPIDLATDTPRAPIALPTVDTSPGHDIAISPDGSRAYVTVSNVSGNADANAVVPLDLAAGRALTPIPFPAGAHDIAISPDGATAYVTNSSGVVPLNLTTGKPGAPVPIPGGAEAIAIAPDGNTAYVTTSTGSVVVPINLATKTAQTPIQVGAGAEAIAITPDGRTAYVATSVLTTPSTEGVLTVSNVVPIDLTTNTPRAPIQLPANAETGRHGIAITPDGRTAYVAVIDGPDATVDANAVVPIDLGTNTLLPPIRFPTGVSPLAIVIAPQ